MMVLSRESQSGTANHDEEEWRKGVPYVNDTCNMMSPYRLSGSDAHLPT
jgi:hypothetical protein